MMPPTPFRFRASRTIQHRQVCRRGRQKIDIVPACEGDRYSRVGDPNLELSTGSCWGRGYILLREKL
jgi:hypothetical protein